MAFLHSNRKHLQKKYPGEWLALDGDRLVAHGKDLASVFAKAREKGVQNPFVSRTPPRDEEGTYFIPSVRIDR